MKMKNGKKALIINSVNEETMRTFKMWSVALGLNYSEFFEEILMFYLSKNQEGLKERIPNLKIVKTK